MRRRASVMASREGGRCKIRMASSRPARERGGETRDKKQHVAGGERGKRLYKGNDVVASATLSARGGGIAAEKGETTTTTTTTALSNDGRKSGSRGRLMRGGGRQGWRGRGGGFALCQTTRLTLQEKERKIQSSLCDDLGKTANSIRRGNTCP